MRSDPIFSITRLLLLLSLVTVVLASADSVAQESAPEPESRIGSDAQGNQFFDQRIRPILKQRCYSCHSHESGKAKGGLVLDTRAGWEKGGSSGPAIVPGKPAESLLIAAVRREGFEMPPDERLSADEISLLEQWVARGAPDPRQSKRAGVDRERLWALRPIQDYAPPTVADRSWPRGEIDTFILARLESVGLKPAPSADRNTLLRRVTFDLTGLPPTIDEIEAFAKDSSPDAYETVVDRLLASPAFGDHWARHWFDISCYADLADIDGNVLVRDAWRYRDYVIAAFNSDKPWDRFIHEQLAGDLLPYENVEQRREQIIATGYLAIGPWTLQNYIKGQLAADVVDHQIDRIGRTFLGQTLSCARCHDHKFDPIPTRDYYALAGIFQSTLTTSFDGPGVWSQITHVMLPKVESDPGELLRRQELLENLTARRQGLQAELNSLLVDIPGASTANVLTLRSGIEANQQGRRYEVQFQSGPSVWAAASQQTTAADGLQIGILRTDSTVLAGFEHKPGPWSGTKDAQKMKPATFSYEGDGSGTVRVRITCASPGNGRFGGALDDLIVSCNGTVLFQENFDGLKPGAITGVQADTQLKVLAQAGIPDWDGGGINHSHAVDLGEGNYAVQFFGGNPLALTSAQPVDEPQRQAHSRALEIDKTLQDLATGISRLEQQNAPELALAVRDVPVPADSPIYNRGNFLSLGDIVPRGFLGAVPISTTCDIPPRTSGRLQLAQWLTDPGNPLTARVLVNRIWHHVFGRGLVHSVDYFGVHGELPSHPELLDFLALQLRENDRWSLKTMVRRMVTSQTYQMASTPDPQGAAADPDNRLLWHMPRRRLPAESIRDGMLAASGDLDPARGGPSLGLELADNIRGAGGNVNPATWGGTIADNIKNRRSVFLPLKRERPAGELEILSAFDFPHPSEIVGARSETTVATQALFLLNAPFVKQQAEKLARRLEREIANDERARINRLYLLTVSRAAEPDEVETALRFLDECTAELVSQSGQDAARSQAWNQLCHAVLGSNNFLFRE